MNNESITSHYDDKYFSSYQKEVGDLGGKANLFKFEKSINIDDTVLDFGCGGGFLLNNINCKNKIGVEINPVAREYCINTFNIPCLESIDSVEDNSIDVIISNHCLEHVINPYELITKMYQKLKIGGKIVIVIPLDSHKYTWKPNDVNNHLYSFSPMNLGNQLHGVGFKDISTRALLHKWPPAYKYVYSLFGSRIFHMLGWVYGALNQRWVQVKGEGIKR
jgi:SAM-dependent methyltransferase